MDGDFDQRGPQDLRVDRDKQARAEMASEDERLPRRGRPMIVKAIISARTYDQDSPR